jgi:HTH-type transcriptional regulator/antitoxin HigA
MRSVAESDEAYELASVMAGHRLTEDQDDYLEALSTFIEQYEDKEHLETKKKTHNHEILPDLCEENGMSGADLGRLLEVDRTLATRILRGERNLTVSYIQKICKRFKLSAKRFSNR